MFINWKPHHIEDKICSPSDTNIHSKCLCVVHFPQCRLLLLLLQDPCLHITHIVYISRTSLPHIVGTYSRTPPAKTKHHRNRRNTFQYIIHCRQKSNILKGGGWIFFFLRVHGHARVTTLPPRRDGCGHFKNNEFKHVYAGILKRQIRFTALAHISFFFLRLQKSTPTFLSILSSLSVVRPQPAVTRLASFDFLYAVDRACI